MTSTAWRRQFPSAELLDVVDAVATLVAERTATEVAARIGAGRAPVERMGLSPAEAAEYLGVGEATVRRYIDQGVITVGHLGSRVLIHRGELDRILRGAA